MNYMKFLNEIKRSTPALDNYINQLNKKYDFEELCKKENPLVVLIRLRDKENFDKNDLSLFLAEKLLQSNIDKEQVFDNGRSIMNILHFSCLFIQDNKMSKLILRYCPEQINILTKGQKQESPLALALLKNAYDFTGPHPILNRLLNAGADINEATTKEALWRAYCWHAQSKNLRKWNEWILQNNIDPYMKFEYGRTIFHHMASGKELDPILYMWKKGFLNIDMETDNGLSPRKSLLLSNSKKKNFYQHYIKLEKENLNKAINKNISTSKINRI